jgi:hypothetical protein
VERRGAARRRVLKTGFNVFGDKAPKLECTVRNIFKTGALLQDLTTISIPTIFEVVIDGMRRRCSVVRKTDTRLAVAFK